MNLTVSQQHLLFALKRAEGVTQGDILIETEGANLIVKAARRNSPLNPMLTVRLLADLTEEGGLVVDGRRLLEFVKTLPPVPVHLSDTSCSLLVQTLPPLSTPMRPSILARIPGLDPADYPTFPTRPPFARKATVAAPLLARAIDKTIFAISPDDSRYGLTGAMFELVGDQIRIVTTDGNRLCLAEVPFSGDFLLSSAALVPKFAMLRIRGLVDDDFEGGAILESTDTSNLHLLSVSVGACRLDIPLKKDGAFPPYRRVLPSSFARVAVVDRVTLQDTLRSVLQVAGRGRNNRASFRFCDNELTIASIGNDGSEIRAPLEVLYTGEPTTIGLNVQFLLDILDALDEEAVTIQLNECLEPCVVIPVPHRDADPAFMACSLIMPVRLD